MNGRSIVHGGVFGWTRFWELGWDGRCNRMLEVADAASFYAWGSLYFGVYTWGPLYWGKVWRLNLAGKDKDKSKEGVEK